MNCIICNHELTNSKSIDRQMGNECYRALQMAKMTELFKDDENSLKYNWLIKVEVIKSAFIENFKNTKFRSSFRKSFYSSIASSNRISKKQMKVMEDMLFRDNYNMVKLTELIESRKKMFLTEKTKDIDLTIAIETARRKIRNNKSLTL